ncbi:MAG: prephenate dehydratase [Deltaproteobacteria bacterium RBG_13_58_19]|nr:MAG: prephenate dehydratase [Deltaproteobacteria bacterium RBG_13_58_19]
MTEKEELRHRIDALDEELLTLLNRRQALAQDIGRIKNREGRRTLDFRREEEVLAQLLHKNPGPLSHTALRNIFREIISAAREIQAPLGVAFLGPEATFSHLAALKKFGHATRFGPMATIQEVFGEVEKGNYHYGVVPIENSTEGVVNDTLDLFADTSLKICGEIFLEISHDLLSKSGQRQDLEVIYTHPQAYGQCRRWLTSHLPDLPILEVASTGVAAQKASRNPNAGAIASAFAAPLYDLRVVERRLEDHPGNVTHFFVIGPDAPDLTGSDKTSIIFAVDDIPGALYHTLHPLAERNINMSRIVSRPMKTEAWRYRFFVDLDGHQQDPLVGQALKEIESLSAWFKLLGSFPKAPGVEQLS